MLVTINSHFLILISEGHGFVYVFYKHYIKCLQNHDELQCNHAYQTLLCTKLAYCYENMTTGPQIIKTHDIIWAVHHPAESQLASKLPSKLLINSTHKNGEMYCWQLSNKYTEMCVQMMIQSNIPGK